MMRLEDDYIPESTLERSYLECGLKLMDDSELESDFSSVLHDDAKKLIRLDCERFSALYHALVEKHKDRLSDEVYKSLTSEQFLERAGYDFWLTRNRHGAGFWDREELWGDLSKPLTKLSQAFNGSDFYVGDDLKIHYATETPDMILKGSITETATLEPDLIATDDNKPVLITPGQ